MKAALFAVALLAAMPAQAFVKVTNLSGKPQVVTFNSAGSNETQTIPHNVTVHFGSGIGGMLALADPESARKAEQATPGIGGEILGDLIAANRSARIPANDDERFVIWPDGRLLIQGRVRSDKI